MLAAPLPRRCLSYEKKNWAFFLFFSLQAWKAFFLGPLSATQALPKLLAATSSFTQIPVVSASPSNAQARFIFDLFVIGEREKIVLWLGHPNFITHPTMIGSRQNSLHLNCITTADKWVCKPTVKLLFLFISVWLPPMFICPGEKIPNEMNVFELNPPNPFTFRNQVLHPIVIRCQCQWDAHLTKRQWFWLLQLS